MASTNVVKNLMVCFLVLSALAACGGGSSSSSSGSGEADFASITVEGGGTTVYTETADAAASVGFSPYLTTTATGTSTGTYLYSMDWNAATAQYDMRFELHTWGTGAGTYSITGDSAMVIFMPPGGPTYSSTNVPGYGISGTVNITEFGPVGGKVKGTFDVISLVLTTSVTGTAHLTGSFSVTRM